VPRLQHAAKCVDPHFIPERALRENTWMQVSSNFHTRPHDASADKKTTPERPARTSNVAPSRRRSGQVWSFWPSRMPTMFSTTFRPNGAQIKIRKGACPRDHDMRSPQSCSPDLTPASSASTARSPLPAEGPSPPSAGLLAAAGAGDQAEADWDGELRQRRAGSPRTRV
jgi:hypothetical protein